MANFMSANKKFIGALSRAMKSGSATGHPLFVFYSFFDQFSVHFDH
jgi:hypothetical protein